MVSLSILEDWLRRNGLPYMVPGRRRLHGLIPRTTAILVTLVIWAVALLWAESALAVEEPIPLEELLGHPRVAFALLGVSTLVLLGIPLGLLTVRLQRRLPSTARLILDAVVWAMWLIGLTVIAVLLQSGASFHIDLLSPGDGDAIQVTGEFRLHFSFWERLLLLGVALGLAWLDLGTIIAWTTKRSLKEIMTALPAVARTLPLLLLTVLLAFFTNELWQIGASISKDRMTALGLFLVVLTFLVVLPTSIDMVDDEDSDAEHALLLKQTPFAELAPSPNRLRVAERINLVMVAVAVQAVQITVFVLLTFAVFAIVGTVTLTPELIEEWSGKPSEPVVMLGVQLGMDRAMFRVCLILALFSGVSFAASTLIDDLYRKLFLDRVSEEVRRSIAARHRYQTALANRDRAFRWRTLVMVTGPRKPRS